MSTLASLAAAWRRHRPLLLLLAVVAASWGLFLEVAHELREDRRQPDHGFPFDRPVLNFLHQHPTPALCAVAARLSDLRGPVWLSVYALGACGLGWGLYRRRYREVGFAVGAVGGTMAFNLLAKYHFERLRPDFYHQVCGEVLRQLPDPSFPSGHVMASLALASVAGMLGWHTRWRWVAWGIGLLFALGVAWSRLYLAAHYPSDVLAGWFATGGWVGSLYLAFARYLPTLRPLGQQPGLPTAQRGG